MRQVYSTKILNPEPLIKLMEVHAQVFNFISEKHFGSKNSIVELHSKTYHPARKLFDCPAQVIVRAINSVLSAYKAAKYNKHKLETSVQAKQPFIQLDKRLYKYSKGKFRITTTSGRFDFDIVSYPKLEEMLSKYKFGDPKLYMRNGEVYISLPFEVPEFVPNQTKLAVGIDLGCKVYAATSEGNLYVDKKFNSQKRSLRHNKRKLQSKKKSHSARTKLNKLRRKERNKNRNFVHHLTNRIIRDTKANVLVLENLKSIKVKKHKYQNKNRISQVPMFMIRQFLTYKAHLHQKEVQIVSPAYTSQIDPRTGLKDGIRKGSRYTGKDGQTLHADANAACNLAIISKHPCSISNYLSWQATVNRPIV